MSSLFRSLARMKTVVFTRAEKEDKEQEQFIFLENASMDYIKGSLLNN